MGHHWLINLEVLRITKLDEALDELKIEMAAEFAKTNSNMAQVDQKLTQLYHHELSKPVFSIR